MLFFVREIENKDILFFYVFNVLYCKFLKIKFFFELIGFFNFYLYIFEISKKCIM